MIVTTGTMGCWSSDLLHPNYIILLSLFLSLSLSLIIILQGAAFTAIEPEHGINDLCHFGDSGLLFMATEDSKMLTYYIPVRDPYSSSHGYQSQKSTLQVKDLFCFSLLVLPLDGAHFWIILQKS